jgi:hypothetical protein
MTDLDAKKSNFDVVLHNCKHASFNFVCALVNIGTTRRSIGSNSPFVVENTQTRYTDSVVATIMRELEYEFEYFTISGFAGSGKSTMAERIKQTLAGDCEILAFADKLRNIVLCLSPFTPLLSEKESNINVEHLGSSGLILNLPDLNLSDLNTISKPHPHCVEKKFINTVASVPHDVLVKRYGYEKSKRHIAAFRENLIAVGHGWRSCINEECWIEWLFKNDSKLSEVFDLSTMRANSSKITKSDSISFLFELFFTSVGYDFDYDLFSNDFLESEKKTNTTFRARFTTNLSITHVVTKMLKKWPRCII